MERIYIDALWIGGKSMAEQYQKEKKSIFRRWWFWLLVILLIIIFGSMLGDDDSNKEPVPQEQTKTQEDVNQEDKVEEEPQEKEPEKVQEPDEEVPDTAQTQQEEVSFTNVFVQSDMGITLVYGEVTNNDTKAHSFTLKVSFYDENNNLIGTAVGAVNDLNGGATKIFAATGTDDVANAASYKVQVDTMIETKENQDELISFSNALVRSDLGITTVDVEATNNDTKSHTFTVNIGFYDKDNKLIGVATGAMNDLGPQETKTLSAIANGDLSTAASHKIFIDTMVE